MLWGESTPVVWEDFASSHANFRDCADTALVEHILNGKQPHYSGFSNLPSGSDGAVVIFRSMQNAGYIGRLQEELAKLKWAVLVLVGDELGKFPTAEAYGIHPNMRVWLQYPHPGNDTADRYIPCGYPPQAARIIPGYLLKAWPRQQNWFFSGQTQNQNRMDCAKAFRLRNDGLWHGTRGFWQGMKREEYYRQMVTSKFIPCPHGTGTPDTFRFSEALEARCVPISCARDYLSRVFGEHPIPVVDSWFDAPALMETILPNWKAKSLEIAEWWSDYKQGLVLKMKNDIHELKERGII
jgi:hypothetical protein